MGPWLDFSMSHSLSAWMRVIGWWICLLLLVSGCQKGTLPPLPWTEDDPVWTGQDGSLESPSKRDREKGDGETPTIIPMLNAPLGGVVSVHQALRFVILDFPLNAMPEVDQRLFIYRGKQKVGMVKITGPQEGSHIAADLAEGEAKAGDQVRPD